MTLTLRPYQQDAINAFWDFVAKGGRSGIICAPTGEALRDVLLGMGCTGKAQILRW